MPPTSVSPGTPGAAAPASAPAAPLTIERITVAAGRIHCEVSVAQNCAFTTPELAQRTQIAFPSLSRHACVNDIGDTFGAVIKHTSLPHLLEHLVIDAQTRACPDATKVFLGTTHWLDKTHTKAHIAVNFTDDLVALRAFRDSAEFLNREVIK
ncbi:MAG: hypothetical protein RSD38_02045 [Raoultibacter sp.]